MNSMLLILIDALFIKTKKRKWNLKNKEKITWDVKLIFFKGPYQEVSGDRAKEMEAASCGLNEQKARGSGQQHKNNHC